MHKKKILFVCHEFPPYGGGAATALDKITQHLVNNFDISIATIGGKNSQSHIDEYGRAITYIGKFRHKKLCPSFWEVLRICLSFLINTPILLKKKEPDIIISFFAFPAGFFIELFRKRTIKHFVFLRGIDTPGFKDALYKVHSIIIFPLIKYTLKRCTGIFANGRNLTILLESHWPTLNAVNIHNGVDIQEINYPDLSTVNIIFVGQLIKRKNVLPTLEIIINAAHKAKKKIVFTIVGDGPEKEALHHLSLNSPDNLNINITGHMDRLTLSNLYKNQHIMFHLSESEGLSNTFLEGLSHGLCLFTTNVVAADLLEEQKEFPGFLFETVDVIEITDKLNTLLSDESSLNDIREKTYKYIKDFTWERTASLIKSTLKTQKI